MYFLIGLVLFVVCMAIQFFAFHRKAFTRNLFITVMMYFFAGLVFIAPSAPRFLVWFFFIVTSLYVLVLTFFAILRLRYGNK